MQSDQEAHMQVPVPMCVPMASGDRKSLCESLVETREKRSLDGIKSDGRVASNKEIEDTPDRTSSEDEQQQHTYSGTVHADAGVPPVMSVEVAATASSIATKGRAIIWQRKETSATQEVKAIESARQQSETSSLVNSLKAKLLEARPLKKLASTSQPEERRRKRKTRYKADSTGISQVSARMLFQCSSKLLKSQALDYDVRARETAERNATQAKEIQAWEAKVGSLKRKLEEYAVERPSNKTIGMAVAESNTAVLGAFDEEAKMLLATTSAEAVKSSLPPAVVAVEAKVQEELRKRTQKLQEFRRTLPGFMDKQDLHLF